MSFIIYVVHRQQSMFYSSTAVMVARLCALLFLDIFIFSLLGYNSHFELNKGIFIILFSSSDVYYSLSVSPVMFQGSKYERKAMQSFSV